MGTARRTIHDAVIRARAVRDAARHLRENAAGAVTRAAETVEASRAARTARRPLIADR